MDDSTEGRYYMILGRDFITGLGLYLKFSKLVIEGGSRPYKGFTYPMGNIFTYECKF